MQVPISKLTKQIGKQKHDGGLALRLSERELALSVRAAVFSFGGK
jgi:hypothetical protein